MKLGLVACVLVALGGVARADETDDLVAKGEALAKDGQWSQAIDAFKQADARHARAKHACLIGLAYSRRELWPEAELFFSRCHERATADDPLPTWLAAAEEELAAKLQAAGAVAVTLAVDPPTANVEIALSSFAPDERLRPRTIHLAPGAYVATIDAAAFEPVRRDIVVVAGRPQTVTFHLEPRFHPSRVPLALMIMGAASIAGGIAYDVFALQPARDSLGSSNAAYDAHLDDFRSKRWITVGLLAGGASLAITGVVLRYTLYRHREAPVQVGIRPRDGGAVVTLEWGR